MKKGTKKWLSLVLTLALALTSITLPTSSKKASAESGAFTLYMYCENATTLYMDIWARDGLEFASDVQMSTDFGWDPPQGLLQPVADNENWYSINLTVLDPAANGGFDIYKDNSADKIASYDNQWNSTEDYAVLVGGSQDAYAIKDYVLYTSLADAGLTISTGSDATPAPNTSLEDLKALAATVPADYTTMGFTAASADAVTTALTTANELIAAESTDSAAIDAAYKALSAAIESLVFSADIFVKKISNYDEENSIRGMDISSYLSIMDSFEKVKSNMKEAGASEDEINRIGFKDWDGNVLDEQGFFNLLKASGVNYIRIRVWNDPYDSNGKSYGGGNNDIDTAVKLGRYVTEAGMKTLIDFHLSDFWADPGKQQAPKAWAGYTVEQKADATAAFITDSLTKLVTENGVDVAMVQVGNETNGAVCGVTKWDDMNKIFDAGCDAVHAFSKDIFAVLHFTNPETEGRLLGYAENLADYDGDGDGVKEGVSYDIFASSYYPSWHGTMENLTSVLSEIASKYDKYVMVAETSWANTLHDGDTIGETDFSTGDDVNYSISVQGQANEVRDVANAVNNIDITLSNGNKAALGFFYWEPAWIPVQSLYDEQGNLKPDYEKIAEENKVIWEECGSGWASSYATEYDPDDAGVWYGGSAMDHEAVFDFNGYPLPVLNLFKYLKYGAEAGKIIPDSYTCDDVTIEVGQKVNDVLPKATIIYNDSSVEEKEVNWNQADIDTVNKAAESNDGIGSYTLNGALAEDASFPVKTTVNVTPVNLLADPSFEQADSVWTVTGEGAHIKTGEDKRSGEYCLHFWYGENFTFTASTTTKVDKAGYYNATIYMQGLSNAGARDGESLKLVATTADGTKYSSESTTLGGWVNWQLVTVNNIYVSNDMIQAGNDTITLSVEATLNAEAWGTIDDASLYLNKEEQAPNNPGDDNNNTVTAKPKKVKEVTVTAAKKKMTVNWKKVKNSTGYIVQYSTTKNFKKITKVTVKKTSKVIKGLKRKKTYYVRVRAFVKNDTTKVKGPFSKKVKVTTK